MAVTDASILPLLLARMQPQLPWGMSTQGRPMWEPTAPGVSVPGAQPVVPALSSRLPANLPLNTSPIRQVPQVSPEFTLQAMGQLRQPQLPPAAYPDMAPPPAQPPQVAAAPQQDVPRGTPLQYGQPDALMGYKPQTPDQGRGQQPQSNALLYGLLAAGLGMLANNYGKYGQAGPPIGQGGLTGLNTFLGQRQQEIENVRRDQLARSDEEYKRGLIQSQQMTLEERKRRQQFIENLAQMFPEADRPLVMADPEGYVRGIMAGRKPQGEDIIQQSLPGNKIQEYRRNPATGVLEKWGEPYDRRGEPMRIEVSPQIKTTEDFNQMSAKEQAKSLMDTYNQLQTIPSQLLAMDEAEKALAGAGGFVGSGAETKVAVAKFFNNNFGTNIGAEEVANAEVLRSSIFRQIMENLKKLDAQPSQQQQRIMQESLGNLGTDPAAIPRIIKITRDTLASRAKEHNRRVREAIKNKAVFLYDITIPGFDEPKGVPAWENPELNK